MSTVIARRPEVDETISLKYRFNMLATKKMTQQSTQKQFITIEPERTTVLHLTEISSETVTITVGRNAKATIIENLPKDNQTKNRNIFLTAEEGSAINYLTLVKDDNTERYTFDADLRKDSALTWHIFARVEENLDIRGTLNHRESGTTGKIIAGLDTRGEKITTLDLINNHQAAHTTGDMAFRGLGRDAAKAVINGLIKIGKHAPFTSSYLDEKVLLLSDKARVQAEPNLEILNNEVQASHSATVGNLDEFTLYYMLSRGIDQKTAQTMLIKGFFNPLLALIENPEIQKIVKTLT